MAEPDAQLFRIEHANVVRLVHYDKPSRTLYRVWYFGGSLADDDLRDRFAPRDIQHVLAGAMDGLRHLNVQLGLRHPRIDRRCVRIDEPTVGMPRGILDHVHAATPVAAGDTRGDQAALLAVACEVLVLVAPEPSTALEMMAAQRDRPLAEWGAYDDVWPGSGDGAGGSLSAAYDHPRPAPAAAGRTAVRPASAEPPEAEEWPRTTGAGVAAEHAGVTAAATHVAAHR